MSERSTFYEDFIKSRVVDLESGAELYVVRRSRRKKPRRILRAALGTLVLIFVAVCAVFFLNARVERQALALPVNQPGTTWLLLGSDTRESLTVHQEHLSGQGSPTGQRADIIVIVHHTENSSVTLNVPRDLLLPTLDSLPLKAAHLLRDGPQDLVDGICLGLRLAADHVAVLDMEGFMKVVDALGGINIRIEEPINDPQVGLKLAAGEHHLDGGDALSMVRSRSTLDHSTLDAVPIQGGATQRGDKSMMVMDSLHQSFRSSLWNPIRVWKTLWHTSEHLSLSEDTNLWSFHNVRPSENILQIPTLTIDGTSLIQIDSKQMDRSSFFGERTCEPTSR